MARRFMACSTCMKQWPTASSFLSDPDVKVVGYQVDFVELESGFFLFNHLPGNCGTTLAVDVSALSHLHDGEVFSDRLEGRADCVGYCLNRANLTPCPAKCECGFVRNVLATIRSWPKAVR